MPKNGRYATNISTEPKPNLELWEGAERYGVAHGLPSADINYKAIVSCPLLGRRIAVDYEAAPLLDDAARPAYAAFCDETWRQLDFLTRSVRRGGLGFTVVISGRDPYSDISGLCADLAGRRLQIWTSEGCGNPHPLLSEHDNDAFRAVHDAFGHGATGCGFDADGEEAAWWAHRALFSPLARRALLSETRGQTCALFYGSRPGFPVQKAALLAERFGELATLHREPCTGRCVS